MELTSLVVITRDRCETLLATLQRLAAVEGVAEILLLDNGSADGSPEAVRESFPFVNVIALGRNYGAVARNIGVRTAQTPYVAFADDDTWWERGSIKSAAELMERYPKLAVVTARIVVEPAGIPDPICAELEASPLPRDDRFPGPQLISFLAGASVVRRDAFLAVGGFNERFFLGGEEELLAADLISEGWQLGYAEDLVVHHLPSPLRDAHRRRADGIRNTLWFTWLRRPAFSAVRRTAGLLRRLPADRVTLNGLVAAVRGVPWVLRERRPVPAAVEPWYRLMDRAQLRSRARRYVS